MDELTDSSLIAGDSAALRQRFAADGYVFIRRLRSAGSGLAGGTAVTALLKTGGWLTEDGRCR